MYPYAFVFEEFAAIVPGVAPPVTSTEEVTVVEPLGRP
jgi:hypothetical protein